MVTYIKLETSIKTKKKRKVGCFQYYEKAIERAIQVATNRKDTNSIHFKKELNFIKYIK